MTMTYTLHRITSSVHGRPIPNRYAAYDHNCEYVCQLQRDPAGWRRWRCGDLYPTAEAAVLDAMEGR